MFFNPTVPVLALYFKLMYSSIEHSKIFSFTNLNIFSIFLSEILIKTLCNGFNPSLLWGLKSDMYKTNMRRKIEI